MRIFGFSIKPFRTERQVYADVANKYFDSIPADSPIWKEEYPFVVACKMQQVAKEEWDKRRLQNV